ncbi:Basic leucine zipper 43 [Hibiscus syriacus]|uniref:Basic leucine zipper 43 n=1 Tax=Hibiscus syriacus TaxID=106335 RepID=A0A6A2YA26_HIBSY|nr:basic leucine zipper 43-like [Hibiscus syriacus]KAE8671079.1 Basic leucine zipper 43 [Hibiscus syriacus]
MYPTEVSRIQYPLPANPSPYSAHFSMIQTNTPSFEFNRFSNTLHNFYIPPQICEINPHSSCICSNSTSDEADELEQQQSLVNERKQRRVISNRESARRSRIRKQRLLDELWAHLVWLRNENHQLIDKLNNVSKTHVEVVQENAQLKEEASKLRQMLSDMQPSSPYYSLRYLEDFTLESGLSDI